MHPFAPDVHRTHPITVCPIVTSTKAIGSASHLVEMAAMRTRLGRVRFTDEHALYPMTLQFIRSIGFQTAKCQGAHILIGSPGPEMPFFVVKRAQIACIQHRDAMHDTEGHHRVGCMMQDMARHLLHFLASFVSGSMQTLTSTRAWLRACPFFAQFGLRFSSTLFDRAKATTRHGQRVVAI